MESLKLSFQGWLQGQYLQFIETHPKIQSLCPLPPLRVNPNPKNDILQLTEMSCDVICVDEGAITGLIVGHESTRTNGKDQNAYFNRLELIKILEAISEDQISLTVQEDYPLIITPTNKYFEYSITLAPMNYNEEIEENKEDEDDE